MRSKLWWGRRALVALGAVLLATGSAAIMGVNPASGTANGAAGFSIASPAPTILQGETDQAGSNITFSLLNDWSGSDNTVTVTVAPNGDTVNNCTTATSTVFFASVPTVSATAVAGTTTPTFSAALSNNASDTGGCTGSTADELTITITNTASGTSSDTFPVTISNISYDVGSTAAVGPVALFATTSVPVAVTTPASITSDATVLAHGPATVTANNPVVQITQSASGSPSSIVIAESSAGAVTGTICISEATTSVPFTFASAGTVSASSNSGAGVVGAASITGGNLVASITTPSTSATTYTFSGFTVNDGSTTGAASVTVTSGNTGCSTNTTSLSLGVTIFGSAPTLNSAIAGADTDATAIAELEEAFPPGSGCIPGNSVILATDQNFPDALAASYLAGNLDTGILLTPTNSLSAETQQAIQTEGITNVYVVGGPLAVSQNVITEIEALPAYDCNSSTKTGSNVTVTGPIYGQTQYDTAQQIAAYVTNPAQQVGAADLSGAYAGQYNDTTGMESSSASASGSIRTALVTSGANFPDATAGSIISYRQHFPVVLTTPSALSSQASTTLTALGIKQAIVLGGPLAVSDADVASIQALGISVIRIAGQDQTDTAQELASFELNQSANDTGLGWGSTTGLWNRQILLARGDFYADALAGSVLGKLGAYPILLTENPSSIGEYLTTFLNAGGSSAGIDSLNSVSGYSGNIQTIQPLGGPLALQYATLSAAVSAVAAG